MLSLLAPCLCLLFALPPASSETITLPPGSQLSSYPSLSYLETFHLANGAPEKPSGVKFDNVDIYGYAGYKCLQDDEVLDKTNCSTSPATITLSYVTFKESYDCGRVSPNNMLYDPTECNWSNYGFGHTDYDSRSTYFCCKSDYVNTVSGCTDENINQPLFNRELLAKHNGAISQVTLTLTDTLPKTLESLESLKSTSDAFSTDGYYITAIISCDESSSIIPVAGEIEIYSNDSLLPGTYTDINYFYLVYTLLSFLMLASYIVTLFRNSTADRLSLHNHLLLLLMLLFIEALVYSALYFIWDRDGVRPHGLKMVALGFSVLKRTWMRFVLLTLSLGLGISTPTLPKRTWLVITVLSAAYFAASLSYFLVTTLDRNFGAEEPEPQGVLFLLLIINVLNVVFYVYIFEGLMNTIKALKAERQTEKCRSYLAFRRVLTASVVCAILFTIIEIVDYVSPIEALGGYVWFFDEDWVNVLYYVVSAGVCWIYRPRARLGSLADMIELSNMDSDDDDEGAFDPNISDDEMEEDEGEFEVGGGRGVEVSSGGGDNNNGAFNMRQLEALADDSGEDEMQL